LGQSRVLDLDPEALAGLIVLADEDLADFRGELVEGIPFCDVAVEEGRSGLEIVAENSSGFWREGGNREELVYQKDRLIWKGRSDGFVELEVESELAISRVRRSPAQNLATVSILSVARCFCARVSLLRGAVRHTMVVYRRSLDRQASAGGFICI